MSVAVKRSIHVHVKVDIPFKKNYILLVNRLIEDLNYKMSSYQLAIKSKQGDVTFKAFITQKMNETILQIEQLKQKVSEVKKCKVGDLFLMSMVDGQVELAEGDDLLSVLSPISIQAEGTKISKILA